LWVVSQAVAGLALAIVGLALRSRFLGLKPPEAGAFHDLGKLLLAFVMLWAYMAFSQFLIIWYANIPEEVVWYVRRTEHGWQYAAAALAALHFALPFLVLLSRDVKRHPAALAGIALLVLFMRWVDILWLVQPAFARDGVYVPWLDAAATLGIGGFCVAWWAFDLRRASRRDATRHVSASGGREAFTHG
jgi:hypothetical protein